MANLLVDFPKLLIPYNVFAVAQASNYLVAIDDGHGEGTLGKRTPYIKSLGRAIKENEFNSAVAKYLDEELKRCGFRTVQLAPTGYDTPLKERTDLANKLGADILISLHFDALDGKFDGQGKDPEGMTIFVYNGHKNKTAGKLADAVGEFLKQGTAQVYRGIKEKDLHMLRESNMPGILIEHGFMDNEREALLMINTVYQKECAREEAQGICKFFNVPYVPYIPPKPAAKPSAAKKIMRVQVGAFSRKDGAVILQQQLNKFPDFRGSLVVKEGAYWKVQVGAFSVKSNAEALSAKLKAKGFPNFIK